MYLIFLVPIFWIISLPLILKIFSTFFFVIVSIIYCYKYFVRKKIEKAEELKKYKNFFNKKGVDEKYEI